MIKKDKVDAEAIRMAKKIARKKSASKKKKAGGGSEKGPKRIPGVK